MKKLLILLYLFIFIFFSCSGVNFRNFRTDTTKSSIELDKVLSGGPGKDGIPAINNPSFININESKLDNSTLGLFINIDNIQKFYPFNILVWHEIVNDKIGDSYITVTFCPLCGSGIVFNREFDNRVHTFGVSGYLYESNLLMYDKFSESLWSQSLGEAVIGKYTGQKLERIPVNVLDFETVKKNFPKTQILSEDTGFSRNYGYYPYGNYETSDDIYFPISGYNNKFHPKEMMYIFEYKDKYYTFPVKSLESSTEYKSNNVVIKITIDKGVIKVYIEDILIPGYYEMWFSWAIHNYERGIILDLSK